MKILVVDCGNTISESNIYKYYGDIFREMDSLCELEIVQAPGFYFSVDQLINGRNDIDCILFAWGYFTQGDKTAYGKIEGLAEIEIPVVCMVYKPQTLLEEKLEFCKTNNVNLIVDSHSTYKDFEKITGIRAIRLPFSATPKYFHARDVEKEYDVGFCGAFHGNGKIKGEAQDLRPRIHDVLSSLSLKTYWRGQYTPSDRIASTDEYAANMNKSKIWISTTGPVDDMGPRYFEVTLSKALLFCNKMVDTYEEYFIDGVNCVMFENNLSDFEDKLDFYIKNDTEREKIIENAYLLTSNNHTWKHMALQLLEEIKNETGK